MPAYHSFRPVALLALALLGGCVNLGGGKAPAMLIRLTPQDSAPAGTAVTAQPAEAVMVIEPEADRSLAAPRVAVQVSDTTIAYMKDGVWAERPARQFRALLAEAIRAGGKRLVVEDDQGEVHAGQRLSGRLLAMGYDARSRSVVVRYDGLWQAPGGAVSTRRFEAVEKNVAPEGNAVAPALGRAANRVARAVADWIG